MVLLRPPESSRTLFSNIFNDGHFLRDLCCDPFDHVYDLLHQMVDGKPEQRLVSVDVFARMQRSVPPFTNLTGLDIKLHLCYHGCIEYLVLICEALSIFVIVSGQASRGSYDSWKTNSIGKS